MRTDLIFFELAKKDLETANYLFHLKIYPYSIFHFQQAIEKAIKSFGLWSGIISEKEAEKNIGHNILRFYLKYFDYIDIHLDKILKNFSKFKQADFMKEINLSEWKHKIQENKKFLVSLLNKKIDFPSNEILQKIKNEISELEKLAKENIKHTTVTEEELNRFKKAFDAVSNTALNNNPIITPQSLFANYKEIKKYVYKYFYNLVALLYLASIFTPHAVKSRYPQNDFNPLEVYNNKMPLIQMFKFFYKIAKEIFKDFENIYKQGENISEVYSRLVDYMDKYGH